jgi:hypothetical protein
MSRKFIYMIFGILALVLMVGCRQTTPSKTIAESTKIPTTQPVEPTSEPTEEPVGPTEISEVVVNESPSEDIPEDECLNCHSDKQSLIDNAKPEEEVASESSGEG